MRTHDITIAPAVNAAGGIHLFTPLRGKSRRDRSAAPASVRTFTTNSVNPTNSMHRHIVNANNFCR